MPVIFVDKLEFIAFHILQLYLSKNFEVVIAII